MKSSQLRNNIYEYIEFIAKKHLEKNSFFIIWANQNGHRPDCKLLITLNLLSGPKRVGQDIEEVEPTKTYIKHSGHRERVLSINALGEGAEDFLEEIQNGVSYQDNIFKRSELGFSIFNVGDLNDLTNILNVDFVERFQIDLSLYNKVSNDVEQDYIEDISKLNFN